MIAIVGSILLGAYLLFPDFLFRKLAKNFRDVTKAPQGRFGEIFSAIGPPALPFLFASIASRFLWFVGHWPVPLGESVAQKHCEYRTVISALWSDTYFHEHLNATWAAISNVLWNQARFLCWMYAALAIEISAVVLLTYFFGSLSGFDLYRWTFGKLVLGRASHWQVLLTAYAFPRKARTQVVVDAMTTDDHLYQGTVGDFFLNAEGELTGLLLKNFKRYKRAELEADRKAGLGRDSKDYWKEIPGANFYLPADKIANLNIRYETPETATGMVQDVQRLLKEMNVGKVTVSFEKSEDSASAQGGDSKDQAGPSSSK